MGEIQTASHFVVWAWQCGLRLIYVSSVRRCVCFCASVFHSALLRREVCLIHERFIPSLRGFSTFLLHPSILCIVYKGICFVLGFSKLRLLWHFYKRHNIKLHPFHSFFLCFFFLSSSLQPKEMLKETQKVALCHLVEQKRPKSRTKPINDWQKVDFVSSAQSCSASLKPVFYMAYTNIKPRLNGSDPFVLVVWKGVNYIINI